MRALIFATVLSIGGAGGALAAVRVCLEAVTSGQKIEASEEAARKTALDAWVKAVEINGPQFSSWRLALERELTCKPAADARFECEARARPCTIQQQPPKDLPLIPRKDPLAPPKDAPAPAKPPPKGVNT
jgi:hypothetical protein